ncbi:sugar-binding transcriptional regulator [Neobacillus mesonae]|uniref:sugar-binding transcriptional regulator n=1 Tax=Neobacillus mesonae TaxID=1193713 RepID=UPI00203E3860|nr:sugar-binding domain-containing protein [Neobacillus mesonae]MCM3568982.1 helix-turn-helix domain-containing protein [Neobacillus mesonae]
MENKRVIIQVSHMYYELNMTQQQIANQLGISRMSISRILQRARDEGVVSIKINYEGAFLDVEEKLVKKYRIKNAVVCVNEGENSLKEILASSTADFLKYHIKKGMTISVGWGTTLSNIPKYLEMNDDLGLLFVPMIGGHGKSSLDLHSTQIASNLAKKTGGGVLPLLAPAMVKTREEKHAIISNSFVSSSLEKAAKADMAIMSLGSPLSDNPTIIRSGYFSKEEIDEFKAENAECDIVSIVYINRDGNECNTNISERSIGITKEQLKSISYKICVTGGNDKHLATKLALEHGYIDVLITDIDTADFLLKA